MALWIFFLAIWVIESLIFISILVRFAGEEIKLVFSKTPALKSSLTTSMACFARMQSLVEDIISHLGVCSHFLYAKSRKVGEHTTLMLMSNAARVHRAVKHVADLAGNCAVKGWQSHAARKIHQIQEPAQDNNHSFSALCLAEEYRLLIPTTFIEGLLNTATLHKAYFTLADTSLTFHQLETAQRYTAIYKIANDMINYSHGIGHVWSMKTTFAEAAQLVQNQFDADWVERYLRFQTMDFYSSLGEQDSEITATFIAMVFVLICDLPSPRRPSADKWRSLS